MNKLDFIEQPQLRTLPQFQPGDTVKVQVRVVEGDKERLQAFQGVVIRRQGGGLRETFTVRKISFGVGVERTFPVHSPSIAKVEILTKGHVRRAKLYYLRELRGKKARIKERRDAVIEEWVEEEPEEAPEASSAETQEASEVSSAETQEASEASSAETQEVSAPEAPEAEETPEAPEASDAPEGEESSDEGQG